MIKKCGYDSKGVSEEFNTKNEAKRALLKFKKKDAVCIHIIEVELIKPWIFLYKCKYRLLLYYNLNNAFKYTYFHISLSLIYIVFKPSKFHIWHFNLNSPPISPQIKSLDVLCPNFKICLDIFRIFWYFTHVPFHSIYLHSYSFPSVYSFYRPYSFTYIIFPKSFSTHWLKILSHFMTHPISALPPLIHIYFPMSPYLLWHTHLYMLDLYTTSPKSFSIHWAKIFIVLATPTRFFPLCSASPNHSLQTLCSLYLSTFPTFLYFCSIDLIYSILM